MKEEIIISGCITGFKELQTIFSALNDGDTLRLTGKFEWLLGANDALTISASNITIDASDADITVTQHEAPASAMSIINIAKGARYVIIKGLRLNYSYFGPVSEQSVSAVENCGRNVSITDAFILMCTPVQLKLTGILNNAGSSGLDGKCCCIERNRVYIYQNTTEFPFNSFSCGIANDKGDNFYCCGNYVFSQNNGNGSGQTAVGIYNSGTAAFIDNNNIKGNGSHNTGTELEHCYAYGAIDDGISSIWSNNNLVGEWGGSCCAILCRGQNIRVTRSKLLGTHTIKGRTVKLYGNNCCLDNNVITTTSRNPRIIEVKGYNCSIMYNMLDAVLGQWDAYFTACGMYFDNVKSAYAEGNAIMIMKDCGIFLDNSSVILEGNIIDNNIYNPFYCEISDNNDAFMAQLLNESGIKSMVTE